MFNWFYEQEMIGSVLFCGVYLHSDINFWINAFFK